VDTVVASMGMVMAENINPEAEYRCPFCKSEYKSLEELAYHLFGDCCDIARPQLRIVKQKLENLR